jgi:GNAT superfamily N-acetyltransferase
MISPALAERVEAETYADYEAAARGPARAAAGAGQLRVGGGVALAVPKDATGFWNRVVGLGLAEPVSARLLGIVTEFYWSYGITEAALALAPSALPSDWGRICPELNISPAEATTVKLARETGPARERAAEHLARLDAGLRLGPVESGQAGEFAQAKSAAFLGAAGSGAYQVDTSYGLIGRPGWQSFAVFDGATIVAAASLHVVGNVGHLFGGGTLPAYRGRGAQSALIAARVEAAWDAGCDWVMAEAAAGDNPSLRNLGRAGLRRCYERPHWTWREGNRG